MAITRADLDYLHHLPGEEDIDPELVAAVVREGTDTTSAERPYGCNRCGTPSEHAFCSPCHEAVTGIPLL